MAPVDHLPGFFTGKPGKLYVEYGFIVKHPEQATSSVTRWEATTEQKCW